jgi:hypothetical protein
MHPRAEAELLLREVGGCAKRSDAQAELAQQRYGLG